MLISVLERNAHALLHLSNSEYFHLITSLLVDYQNGLLM